ncbi:tolloid-like protein 2 [Seriola aureovittata]|uniref:tolloid-like protein 2 n=1 Tax=Seriola aureovittata TaxID=2871759 RepID=UPI0024BEED90|nr:tolloid-like protein 2 [Seriola aureovittata]
MWNFIVVLVLLTAGYRAQVYDNNPEGVLFRVCPYRHVVSQIKSSHTDSDRQWKIECNTELNALDSTRQCYWSSFYKLYEQEMSFNCRANGVVAGVYSDYSGSHGDRRWIFLCCTSPKLITFECRETPMVNYWNENFNWHVPGDNLLTGVQTHNKNNNGDHRWSFSYCRGITTDDLAVSSQILSANSPMENLLTEGDVMVPRTRNARVCGNCRWPKSNQVVQVPYTISDAFSSSEKVAIQNAIDDFHLSTCIRFTLRTGQTSYISIVKKVGCWSLIGRSGATQELSLGNGCINNGIIQHELIHALGFWHEQSRTDRDIYVKINYENILSGRERNFHLLETNNLNVPYDYSSVMHYGAKDFSKNGRDTITPLSPTATIGQRIRMSDNDILKINKVYSCRNYLHKNGEWDNELGGVLSRQCPSGQAVSAIRSSHNDDKNDRLWGISCKAFKVTRTCQWSRYVNEYWGHMDFKCANNEVIAGVHSVYNSIMGDRRWKFYCCSAPGFTMVNCKDEPLVNYWKEYFNWPVASSNYLTGVKSYFDSQTRDRRWSFTYCQRNLP